MKKLIQILIVFLLFSALCSAQEVVCDTESIPGDTLMMPYFGNNQILDQVLEETMPGGLAGFRTAVGNDNGNIQFHIPIKIWLYHDIDGSNAALPFDRIPELIERVNQEFANNNTGIRFFLKCDVTNVNSNRFNIITRDRDYNDMLGIFTSQEHLTGI